MVHLVVFLACVLRATTKKVVNVLEEKSAPSEKIVATSMSDMMGELGLSSFRTLFNNCVPKVNQRWLTSVNIAVRHFIYITYVQLSAHFFISF